MEALHPTPLEKTNLALSGLAFILAIALIAISQANVALQRQLQAQQIQINNGRLTQQVATNIIRDTAQISISTKDQALINLLKKHGFEVKVNSGNPQNVPSNPR